MVLQLLIAGIALGSIYALLALALVLIHKATEVVNFAQGEMAMVGTFIAYVLVKNLGLPLPLMLLLALPLGLVLGGITELLAIRPLAGSPPVNLLIVSIGLWMVFHYSAGWIWGYDPLSFPSLFPEKPIVVLGLHVSPNSLAITGISFLLVIALFVFFEYTREGTAMRAASANPRAARLMGVKVQRVSTLSWMIGGAISQVMGLLVAPLIFIDVDMMVSTLLKAFAGAILGGFNSLPGAIVGGIAIGVIENFIGAYVSMAFKESFSFLVIIAVLMFRPTGLFGAEGRRRV
jgi:branched-chain amino acid transport system permease protein